MAGIDTYSASGSVTVGIWAKRTAGWQKVMNKTHLVGGPVNAAGQYTWPFSVSDFSVQLGSDVKAVGLTIETFSGDSAALTSFSKLAWQASGSASGTRSATPNGEKTTVTVSP